MNFEMDKSKKTIDFIKISSIKHDNFYNYDKSIYAGAKTKLIITCPLHGDFEQTPPNHKSGQGCFKCGHTCKENRPTQGLFECIKCGFTENADFQATLNLFQRGQSLMEANVNQ